MYFSWSESLTCIWTRRQILKIKLANGVTGHLIQIFTGQTVFRVYDDNHNFVDYDLRHSDLTVTINDEDAYFYRDEYNDVLDHSPKTLGQDNGKD
jgi:hypothetical protein